MDDPETRRAMHFGQEAFEHHRNPMVGNGMGVGFGGAVGPGSGMDDPVFRK